jgi:hypothetical protein
MRKREVGVSILEDGSRSGFFGATRQAKEPLAKFVTAFIHPKLQLGVWRAEILRTVSTVLPTRRIMLGAMLNVPTQTVKTVSENQTLPEPQAEAWGE